MKRVTFGAFAFALLFMILPAAAQDDAAMVDPMIELMRSDINKDKVAIIGAAMNFSSEDASLFWPIYKNYETELRAVGDQRVALIKDFINNFETMTDAKAGELAGMAMEIEKQRMKLKHACYKKLAADVSPVVGARFLQVETQLNLLLDLQLAEEMPLIEMP